MPDKTMADLSYSHGAGDVPLLGETIGENLRRTVERFGDREALVSRHQDFRATYEEFWDLTSRCAKGLLARGVKKGDRVGIWSPNRYEWVVVQYATARIGAILVNINPAYKTAELEYALNQSGTSFLVLARAFRSKGPQGGNARSLHQRARPRVRRQRSDRLAWRTPVKPRRSQIDSQT